MRILIVIALLNFFGDTVIAGSPERRSFMCGVTSVSYSLNIEKDTRSPRLGLTFIFVRIPRGRILVNVHAVRRSGLQTGIYKEIVRLGDCVISNGGFWGYDRSGRKMPLGLIISQGRRSNPKISWTTGGALCWANEQLTFIRARAIGKTSNCSEAIQSKPLLVEDGKIAVPNIDRDLFNRTAVGVDVDGNIIIAGAFSPDGRAVSLVEFASYLVKESSRTGSRISIALGLDGGPGAQLWIPPLNERYGSGTHNYVPSVIHFTNKDEN